MATQIETRAGLTTVEKKGYRYRLWTHYGYSGSVMKNADGFWRFAYKDEDGNQVESELFEERAHAIRQGINSMIVMNIIGAD